MKQKIIKLLPTFLLQLPLCMVMLGVGCEVEPIDPEPGKAILGKWEVIENTFGTVSYPGAYEEYRLDSIIFYYNSKRDTAYGKYWFSDSLLYKDNQPYKFEFVTYDKIRLELQYPGVITGFVYKRIK